MHFPIHLYCSKLLHANPVLLKNNKSFCLLATKTRLIDDTKDEFNLVEIELALDSRKMHTITIFKCRFCGKH